MLKTHHRGVRRHLGFLAFCMSRPPARDQLQLIIYVRVTALTVRSADQSLPYPVSTMGFTGSLGGYDVQLNGSVQVLLPPPSALHVIHSSPLLTRYRKSTHK
jgi:hypothetical protein